MPSNKSLKMVIGIGGGLILILIVGIILILQQKMKYTVYDTDTVIEGNWVVASGNPVILKNNAKLTVTGDAVINDSIKCDGGGLNLVVEGSLIMNDEFVCDQDPEKVGSEKSGMNLIVKGHAVFSATSSITSIGSVQLVDDVSRLLTSQEQIDAAFEDVDEDSSAPFQLGPLAENGQDLAYRGESIYIAKQSAGALRSLHDIIIPPVDAAALSGSSLAQEVDQLLKKMHTGNLSEEELDAELRSFLNKAGFAVPKDLASLSIDAAIAIMQIVLADPSPEDFLRWFFEDVLKDGGTVVVVEGVINIGQGGEPPEELDLNDRFNRGGKEQIKPKKIVLNYNFSDNKGVSLQNMTLNGLDGIHYGGVVAFGCTYQGSNGGDAMRFTGRAGHMRIANFTIVNGSGGNGESVVAPNDCDSAEMTGGKGGEPGNIRLVASRGFVVAGTMTIVPGEGGTGGSAKAVVTKDAKKDCPGENAGSAKAKGGDGGDSKQRLRAQGVSGLGNVDIKPALAGFGGIAQADSWDAFGGDGDECGCAGGSGASATAIGGKGGDAFTSATRQNVGGDGGDASARAGNGGDGGSCGVDEGPGGDGGGGGTASATGGKGGSGNVQGTDGVKIQEKGGDGGYGGDGCMEGNGGSLGAGETPGEPGEKGENTCTAPPKDYQIAVISYGGSFIPVYLIHVSGPDICDGDHWHGGPATMLNGETASDPDPNACGFGKTSDKSIIAQGIGHDEAVGLYGDAVVPFLSPYGSSLDQAPKVVAPTTDFQIKVEGGMFSM